MPANPELKYPHEEPFKADAAVIAAMETLIVAIRSGHDTGTGTRVRQLVWSLYNGEVVVNLSQIYGYLPPELGDAWLIIEKAFLHGAIVDSDLRYVLNNTGEMARFDWFEGEKYLRGLCHKGALAKS